MSLSSFSQIDTTRVKIKSEIARLAIKDILRGDGYKAELEETQRKVTVQDSLINQQKNLIGLLEQKDTNSQSIISLQKQQLNTSVELSKSLQSDVRKLKTKVVLWKVVSIGAIGGAVFLLVK